MPTTPKLLLPCCLMELPRLERDSPRLLYGTPHGQYVVTTVAEVGVLVFPAGEGRKVGCAIARPVGAPVRTIPEAIAMLVK